MTLTADFKKITGELLANIEALKANMEAISQHEDIGKILSELNEVDERRVTLLEPMLLQIRLKEVLDISHDVYLIDYVNRKDPKRGLLTENAVSWFGPTKESGRVTVDALKAIRECLDHRLLDIKDAKRIGELIIEGKIK